MSIFLALVSMVVLISFGGLMAASEAAMSVTSPDTLREFARRKRAARSLRAIASDVRPHRTVTTFVRILAETAAAVVVTLSLIQLGATYWTALVLAILIMSIASFVLAGSSPRSVGRAHPERILGISAPLIHFFRVVLGPLANFLVTMGDKVTPGRPGTTSFATEEQLLSMVDEAVMHDVLENEERALIHSIFDWGDTVAREVMIPRTDMVTIDADTPLKESADYFLQSGYSRLPVVGADIDDVVGILTLRDVARRLLEDEDISSLTASMVAREAIFVPESKMADDTLKHMQAESMHMALVVDEYGGIAGLVTLEDLIEELVGDISDEHDRGMADIEQLGEGHYRVATRLPLDELGELYGLEIEDEDVDSVGGLVTKILGRLPVVGDSVNVSGLLITADVSGSHRKRVTRVTVEPHPELSEVIEAFSEGDS